MNSNRKKVRLAMLGKNANPTVERSGQVRDVSHSKMQIDGAWPTEHTMPVRTRVGAEGLSPGQKDGPWQPETFSRSWRSQALKKRAIAHCAADMCADGETVIINGGTTTCMMAQFLIGKRLEVLTNSFSIAALLVASGNHEVWLPTGQISREQNIVLGPFDGDGTAHYSASKIFLGMYGITEHCLLESDPMQIQTTRRLISQAKQVIVLADSSKFTRRSGLFLCALQQVDCVVTDHGITPDITCMLRKAGIQVTIAKDAHPP